LNFLKQLLGRGCTHRFSWPRSGEDGRYYQICLACGTAYEYDWSLMRRTDRLLVAGIQPGLQGGTLPHFQGLPLK
jgi:hypothetical protein